MKGKWGGAIRRWRQTTSPNEHVRAQFGPRLADHRTAWGLADQALSSGTNFALALFVARSVSPTQFGTFALVLSVYFLVAGIGQGVASGPLAVRYSAAVPARFNEAAGGATGAALLLGLVAGTLCVLVAGATAPSIRLALLALGASLPGLLLQDTWRFVFVAAGRPSQATLNDAVWTIAQVAGFTALLAVNRLTTENLIAAWGFAAAVAAVAGCLQAHQLPRISKSIAWVREEGSLAFRYAIESIVVRGSAQVAAVVVAGLVGINALGALRGAQVVFSPLNFVYLGGLFVAIPEAVRILHRTPERLDRLANVVSSVAVACAAIWTVIALAVTSVAGRQLLGETWASASLLLLPVALQTLGTASSIGPQVALRGLGAATTSLFCQVVSAFAVVGGATAGAETSGVRGAAIGIALGTCVGAAVWWFAFKRERARSPRTARPEASSSDAVAWERRDA